MRRRAPDGFTLLELLLALSLVSIITGSIVGGMHIGRRAWEAGKASAAIDEVEGATRAIAAQISRSFPVAINNNEQGQPSAGFIGAGDACRFVALSEGGGQWGGLILTEIGGENVGGDAELVVWTRVYRPGDGLSPDRPAMLRTTIVKEVAVFDLSYFGQIDKERMGWTNSWKNRPNYPKLVRIRLGANRLGRVIEASMVVALKQQ